MKSAWNSIRKTVACLKAPVISHSGRVRFTQSRVNPSPSPQVFQLRPRFPAVLPVQGSPHPAPIQVTATDEM